MNIEYKVNAPIDVEDFIDVLRECSLGVRRPLDDRACMEGMVANSNLHISAWDSGVLVGIARAMTDFHYACYLSELAIRESYQRRGIGRQLQIVLKAQLGPLCNLILLAAPAANEYYEPLGFESNPRGWVLPPAATIK